MIASRLLAVAAFCLLVLAPAVADAQQQGRVRIQGRDGRAGPGAAPPIAAAIVDPREEMRRLVQGVRSFSRRYRRDFVIIAQNALDLLIKADENDETRKSPARTYIQAIDGVLQEGLFFGIPELDKPTDSERRERLIRPLQVAKSNGLRAFSIDFATSPATIAEALKLNAEAGFLSMVAPARGLEINRLPTYVKRPQGENPHSIVNLNAVRNFAYLRDSATYGRQDQFALKMHDTNYDMLVVDVFHKAGEPLTKQAVATLKYKKVGGRRLVLAYMNIGTAASYQYYWMPEWREGWPMWINAPYPGDPDRHYVAYWSPEWQQIINGDTESYLYGVIAQGFDGVVIDGLESFRFFEGTTEVVQATP